MTTVDPSTLLVRALFRQQVAQLLATVTGVQTETPFVTPVAPRQFPYLAVRDAGDRKAAIGTNYPSFNTSATLEVTGRVQAATKELAQTLLDDLGFRVERAVFAAPGLIRLLQRIASVVTTTEVNGDGDAYVGELDMTIELETFEDFDPTAINPENYPALEAMALNVDLRNVFDPSGDYSGSAPFPDAITAPPRTSGPDGRNEALVGLDLTVAGGGVALLYPARPKVVGSEVLFPDGSTLSSKRGYSVGREIFTTRQDIQDAKAQGAGIIRIPMRWWGPYDPATGSIDIRDDSATATGGINPDRLAEIDARVGWCVEAGLPFVLFLDTNCGQNSLQAGMGEFCGVSGQYAAIGHNLFTDPEVRAKYLASWCFLAKRYANTPGFSALEITPELDWSAAGATDSDYVAYYQDAAARLRPCAPGVPFIVGGAGYSTGKIGEALNRFCPDFIYSANLYVFTTNPDPVANLQTRLNTLTTFRTNKGVPVWLQQLGVRSGEDLPGNVYMKALLNALLAANMGGAWWLQRDGNQSGGFAERWTQGNGTTVIKQDVHDILTTWFAGQVIT